VNIEDTFLAVVDALEELSIPYMIVGSISSSYYGIARPTKDADFVIALGSETIGSITKCLGQQFRLDPQMSFETVTMSRRYVADVIGTPFKIEFFLLRNDPHDQERFRRRQRVSLLNRQIWLPTAEDVIITKLHWGLLDARSKDRADVRDVIAIQGDRIDWDYVHGWCEQHGTRALLDEIRRSIPPI
jgi:hypothetical protein